ncbi:hypothetical protein DPEC_G00361290 [Dallia pectoralis]|uniref:Uncharacterized protein n=1 Tax=Dallia pectoralis TaxID=75939 RepID=A0ACC2F164_DALPE|nr:hypothetical protein DPEC_G00361290 [Dallia pectoralis]
MASVAPVDRKGVGFRSPNPEWRRRRLNICYYHQDLHPRRLHPGPRPRLPCSPRRPSYSSRRSPRGSRGRRGRVGRPICTSGPLRTSTRVSSGFALPRHSSPSFGYHRVRSCSTSPTERARRAGGAPRPGGQGSHLSRRAPALTFIAPRGVSVKPSDSRTR